MLTLSILPLISAVYFVQNDQIENTNNGYLVNFTSNVNLSYFTTNATGIFLGSPYNTSTIGILEVNSSNANIYFINLTNGLIYNTNGSSYGSTNISANDGYVLLNLGSGHQGYALDNFNVTEGVSRQNSPITFSTNVLEDGNKNKHIVSTLSDNVVVLTKISIGGYSCNTVNQIDYTPYGGVTQTYNDNLARSICEDLTSTGYVLTINGGGSNNLVISYNTTTIASSILKVLIGLIAIIILISLVGMFYLQNQDKILSMSGKEFIQAAVTLLVIVILGIVLMNYIATLV